MKRFVLFTAILTLISLSPVSAQVPTVQDCMGAIPVCLNTYNEFNGYTGVGNYNDIPSGSCPVTCMSAGERNSVWYTFTVQTSGWFDLRITPWVMSDDYDWAIFNMTTANCSDLQNTALLQQLEVSCNWSADGGITGANNLSPNTGVDCWGSASDANNPQIWVNAGETYYLNISNYTGYGAGHGYQLDMTHGTATIADMIPPVLTGISSVSCGASTFTINFSENILCSTITTGDFTLNGPGGPYTITSVTGNVCSLGGTMENTFTVTVSPAMTTTGTYTFDLVNTAGSVSDLCGNIALPASFNFNISGLTVSVSPASSSICNGQSVNLTASGATSYTWTPATGLSATTGANVTATPGSTTTYTVTGTTGGCSSSATATVTVSAGPTITLSASPGTSVCAGDVVTIDASSSVGGTTFTWSTGGSGSQITPTVNTTTTYTVTGTAAGCSGSEAITITVTSNPTITVSPANPVICNSQSTTLTASGASTYTWSPPTGLSGTTGATVTANPTSTTTYTVNGANGSCTGSTTVTVSVNALPTATVSGGGNICNDGSSTVTVTITLTGTPPWSLTYTDGTNSTTVSGINTSPYTFTTSTAGIYTVSALNDANCPGSSNGAALVNVYPLPNVTLAAFNAVCLNTPVFPLNGGAPAGGTYSGPGVSSNNFNAATAGTGNHTITYTYTDGNGCTNTATNTITVYGLPAVDLPPLAGTCLNTPAYPLNTGTPAGGNYSGNGVAANTFNPAAAGLGSHVITYTYTDGNSCTNSDTASITVNALPVVTFDPLAPTCLNSAPFNLIGGNPAGGSYSGTGVGNDIFDPASSGSGNFTITYTYTDPGSGCTNTATQNQLVNILPVLSHNPLTDVCISTPPFLLSGGQPSGGSYSGTGVNNNIFDPAAAGNGVHTLTYTYTDPATNCTNQITVDQTVALNIPISVSPSSAFVCEGGSVTLTASGANSFTWSPSTGLTSTVGSAVISTPPTSITYTVTGSNADGCSGTTTATVNIYPVVDVNFLAVPQNGCKPLNVQFLFTPGPQVQDSTFEWNFGDILSENNTSTEEDPTHLFIEEGNYTVTLTITSVNGCTHSGTMPVNVYAKPTADFYWTPEVGNTANPQIWFVDASTGANYWYWNFGDPASGNDNESNDSHPVHTYSDSGYFEVQLIVEANQGCADTMIKWITIYPETLIYIPNAFTPDNNQLNDTWGPSIIGILEEGYTLEIWDRWGKRVFVTNNTTERWNGRVGEKVAPAGVYVWALKYRDPAGKDYKMKGIVTIVR